MRNEQQHWYVISTKVRREQLARDQLRLRGVTSFLPRVLEPSRQSGNLTVAPLFPGYLFIQIDLNAQYSDVVWTPGVHKFVGFGALPVSLDDDVITFLQQRVGPEGVLRAPCGFQSGDIVRVRRGPLQGLVGIIENPGSGRGRVRVLMELLRRQTSVELPELMLERVSA
jgi:transcriptional antiterminator RfaH